MKAFLGWLTCSVLVMSEGFARDPHVAPNGGPAYPATSNVAGTYAGVMMPRNSGSPSGCAMNSLGIFSLVVPTSGLSNGNFVMFAQGRVFSGTIQAAADAEKATIKGILEATFDFTVTDLSTGITADVTASANGNIDTDITSSSSISLGVGARLSGKAALHIDQGAINPITLEPLPTCQMSLSVDGFKQSNG